MQILQHLSKLPKFLYEQGYAMILSQMNTENNCIKFFCAISITNNPPIRSVQGGEPKRAETDPESEDRFREHDGSAAQRRPFTLMG